MNHLLYLEGAGGISGDMTVAALLDLGASREKLDRVLKSLSLEGFDYVISSKNSYGLAGCDFDVRLHEHEHEHHHHEHRNLADVYTVIDRGEMTPRARATARKIFRIVAEAEAKAHGCPVEDVHFHEVGAIDSIVDIVAAAVCLDDLEIEECVVCALSEGRGVVHCQHGDLPVPVPAVLNIAQSAGIPLRPTENHGEMVTPTGIAIAAAIRTRSELPEQYTVERVGIGLGKRDFGHPNLLRAMLLAPAENPSGQIYLLECNIDDATGEQLGLAMDQLMNAGALDVHFVSCYMKKNRPAYLLRILADAGHLAALEETVFRTTTTIGLRKFPVERTCLERRNISVALPFGDVSVKVCAVPDGSVHCYPEYESVRQVSERSGIDFPTVYQQSKLAAEARHDQN